MAAFDKKMRTSQQKAQRSQVSIAVRLFACAYLIYIVVQLFQSAHKGESGMSVTLMIGIAVFFLLASITILAITVIEFVRAYKAGLYKASAYTDDFEQDGGEMSEPEEPASGIEGDNEDGDDDDE